MNKMKRRKYIAYGNKKQRKYAMGTGFKGFLCSCNNREKDCIKEAYNILNKYADQLYGSEILNQDSVVQQEESDHDDIDQEFKEEMEKLKSKNVDSTSRRFQVVDSGAKNFLFIRTTLENPVELAETIASDIWNTKQEQTRFLIRLIPVEITCKAYVDDIKTAFTSLVDHYFKDSPKSFSVVYNHRNNNNLQKDEVIKEIADMVMTKRSDHKVDLKCADVSVIVEVIKGIALLSVVPNYFKYKKYNLHSVCETRDENMPQTSSTGEKKGTFATNRNESNSECMSKTVLTINETEGSLKDDKHVQANVSIESK